MYSIERGEAYVQSKRERVQVPHRCVEERRGHEPHSPGSSAHIKRRWRLVLAWPLLWSALFRSFPKGREDVSGEKIYEKAPYPQNLIEDLFVGVDVCNIPRIRKSQVSAALSNLPLGYRKVVLSIYRDGETLDFVGKTHGVSRQSVHQWKNKALKIMRRSASLQKYFCREEE